MVRLFHSPTSQYYRNQDLLIFNTLVNLAQRKMVLQKSHVEPQKYLNKLVFLMLTSMAELQALFKYLI